MVISRAVAKVKPSNSCKTVLILGIGNGFLTSCLFTSLKSGIMSESAKLHLDGSNTIYFTVSIVTTKVLEKYQGKSR
jgi:hypothetical protein